jgi:hypothetical protein
MPLTDAQALELVADIEVDPSLSALPENSDSAEAIAMAYNQPAQPPFWVWKTQLRTQDVYSVTTPEATTWSWTTYIQRSVAERDAWREMSQPGFINPSLANVRKGWDDIFSGAGGAAQRTHILTLSRRAATRAEALFAMPPGTGTTTDPATLGFEGALQGRDVLQAWAIVAESI